MSQRSQSSQQSQSQHAYKQARQQPQSKLRIELYLIRHGYSIANRSTTSDEEKWLKSVIKTGYIEKIYESDPSLTRTGIEQSKDASNHVRDFRPNYIFTSVLCRAQQTALFMFPTEQEVVVAPYLKEKNNWVDNPLPVSDNKPFKDILTQYEKRHNILSKEDLQRLLYSEKVLEREKDCEYNHESQNNDGSIKIFLEKYLYPFLMEKHATDKICKIAVVCHGGLIKEFLGIEEVHNNAVYRVFFQNIMDMKHITIPQKPQKPTIRQKAMTLFSGKRTQRTQTREQKQKQTQLPSFSFQMVFPGYKVFKVSCDPRYVQKDQTMIRITYPSQQILSKRDYTPDQLMRI